MMPGEKAPCYSIYDKAPAITWGDGRRCKADENNKRNSRRSDAIFFSPSLAMSHSSTHPVRREEKDGKKPGTLTSPYMLPKVTKSREKH